MQTIVIDGVEYDLVPRQAIGKEQEPLICTLDGYQYFLGPEAPDKMPWEDAIEWCQGLNVGTEDEYELPERQVLLACFMNENNRKKFCVDVYWSSSEFDSSFAWVQSFANGAQSINSKTPYSRVRAVRKVADSNSAHPTKNKIST